MAELPLDRIYIRDLLCRCIVGINPDERENQQDVLLNVTLFADLANAGESDRIADTVNYKNIKNNVVEAVEGSSYFLIERLAQVVADVCLEHKRVKRVVVELDKPGALRFARSVAVQITRDQREHD